MQHTANAAARIQPASLPELEGERYPAGYDGRYRIYTVEHLPFDALPSYGDGGPATVRGQDWNVSYSSVSRALSSPSVAADDDGMVTLKVFRFTGTLTAERHELYGTKYATLRDAKRAAYEAGLLGFMVYEREAARLGLPTVDARVSGQA